MPQSGAGGAKGSPLTSSIVTPYNQRMTHQTEGCRTSGRSSQAFNDLDLSNPGRSTVLGDKTSSRKVSDSSLDVRPQKRARTSLSSQ